MATYQFYLESCEIMDTRSFHEDTIVAGIGVIVNQQVHGTPIAAQVGEHNNGKFAFWKEGLGSLDKVEIGPDDQFVFIYQLYNNGQAGQPSVLDIQRHIALDLLVAANELLAMAKANDDAKAELARLELEHKSLVAQIEAASPQVPSNVVDRVASPRGEAGGTAPSPLRGRAARLGAASNPPSATDKGGMLGNAFGKASGDSSERDRLKLALKELLENQKKLAASLAANEAQSHSFSVLMPGPDWRADGPFATGDYSVKNYSQGKLISVLGNFILSGCDGPLALGFVAGSGRELGQRIPQVGPLRLSGEFRAKDLGWGVLPHCNLAGSNYVVNTIIQRQ